MEEKINDEYLDYAADIYVQYDKKFQKSFSFYNWFQYIYGLKSIVNNSTSVNVMYRG